MRGNGMPLSRRRLLVRAVLLAIGALAVRIERALATADPQREARAAQRLVERLREAVKHGFGRALIPRANAPRGAVKGLEVTAIERVAEALAASG